MKRFVVASIRKDMGKTSFIVGLGRALQGRFGYIKPLGDRLMYRKKQLWDYDSALMVNLFGLQQEASEITIGFEHSKLRYMYTREKIEAKLSEMAQRAEAEKDLLFVEGGRDFSYGSSIHMDPLSVAQSVGASIIAITGGAENQILDDLSLFKHYVESRGVPIHGVVINKIPNLEDFRDTYLPEVQKLGLPVLGAIPHSDELTYHTVGNIAEKLMAKVLTGENQLNEPVRHIVVGAMSADSVQRHPLFLKEDKMIITGGDRNDMMLVAIETNAQAVLLTNNILPPPQIISKFRDRNIPLLLSQKDTYSIALEINSLLPLLTKDNMKRIDFLTNLVEKHVDLKALTA